MEGGAAAPRVVFPYRRTRVRNLPSLGNTRIGLCFAVGCHASSKGSAGGRAGGGSGARVPTEGAAAATGRGEVVRHVH
jgi:hypothetical protein